MSSPEADRFQAALEMHETGLAIQRQNLRRRNPTKSDSEIDALLKEWLADRPLDYSPT